MADAPSPQGLPAGDRRLTARLLVDLGPALKGWADPGAFGVGWDGSILVAARRTITSAVVAALTAIPRRAKESSNDSLILRWRGAAIERVVHPGDSLVACFVQPHPRGVLLAGSRCRWRPEGAEKNAALLDWQGRVLDRFTLGDGIEDLRVTKEGTIWASYFDEGVFGNLGWSHPGPEAIGASGLVAFSPTGEVQFSYDAAAAGTDSICDASATNVTGDGDVWIYFYTEFPIVRIRQGAYRSWALGESGAKALAVHDDKVLLFGDYKQRSLGRVVHLAASGKASVVERLTVEGPDGQSLDAAIAVGAGERLFLLEGRRVFVVEGWR
jgi:hypothetical protein